jgi:hypothetical protein
MSRSRLPALEGSRPPASPREFLRPVTWAVEPWEPEGSPAALFTRFLAPSIRSVPTGSSRRSSWPKSTFWPTEIQRTPSLWRWMANCWKTRTTSRGICGRRAGQRFPTERRHSVRHTRHDDGSDKRSARKLAPHTSISCTRSCPTENPHLSAVGLYQMIASQWNPRHRRRPHRKGRNPRGFGGKGEIVDRAKMLPAS